MNRGKLSIEALALLGGGLCLGLFAAFVFSPAEPRSGSEELRLSIQNLDKVVARLDSTLVRFEEASQLKPTMGEAAVLRSSKEDDSIQDLVRQLESLEKSLSGTLAAASLGSSAQDLQPMMLAENYPQNSQALMDLKPLSEVDVSLGHLDWTYEQILRKFGSPTHIDDGYDNGAVGFVYSDLPGGGHVWINFSRGRVATLSTGWSD